MLVRRAIHLPECGFVDTAFGTPLKSLEKREFPPFLSAPGLAAGLWRNRRVLSQETSQRTGQPKSFLILCKFCVDGLWSDTPDCVGRVRRHYIWC